MQINSYNFGHFTISGCELSWNMPERCYFVQDVTGNMVLSTYLSHRIKSDPNALKHSKKQKQNNNDFDSP